MSFLDFFVAEDIADKSSTPALRFSPDRVSVAKGSGGILLLRKSLEVRGGDSRI